MPTEAQDYVLRFLESVHGPYSSQSLLDDHPIAQELCMERGDLVVRFEEHRFVLRKDGGFYALPENIKL